MKGAPERIIEKCSTIFIDGQDIEMNYCNYFYYQTDFNLKNFELSSSSLFRLKLSLLFENKLRFVYF